MATQQVLVNGKSFSASDITVIVGGINIASVSSLTLTVEQEKTNNPGFSDGPVSRGRGVKEYTASIEMEYKDVIKLRNLSPTRGLLEVPMFDVLAVLNNSVNVSRIRARYAEFTDDGIEVASGDTETKREYALTIADIDFLDN